MRNSAATELAIWRRAVAELYGEVRETYDPRLAWAKWVDGRNQIFKEMAQSPLDAAQRGRPHGLSYYDYDIDLRTVGRINYEVEPELYSVELGDEGTLKYQRVAMVHFRLPSGSFRLNLYWILGYGGGLFLPFKDLTNGGETFGGGRYLYDTIKGADLGVSWEAITLDFNFAYNPSCAYSERWLCPLAPDENELPLAVTAGEKLF
ncbi:MAG: DUF1684 domain-containing protein [Candidatus Promineifilaceae bacterium]|jgi:hypothetical protein